MLKDIRGFSMTALLYFHIFFVAYMFLKTQQKQKLTLSKQNSVLIKNGVSRWSYRSIVLYDSLPQLSIFIKHAAFPGCRLKMPLKWDR